MAGGKATPKKDKSLKVSGGSMVKSGQILVRGIPTYKAGLNVRGINTIYAACAGKVSFSHKKISSGKVRVFINVTPSNK